MTRRSNTAGSSLRLTFSNGETVKVHQVHVPLGDVRVGETDSAYKIAQFEYRADVSVTARVGLLLQNSGESSADDVTVSISIPSGLQMTFAEQQPPPKVARKSPVVPIEPSPRSWVSDTETRAHCRVARVASSVGLPPIFLTLKDRKGEGDFPLDVTITIAHVATDQAERLTVQFVQVVAAPPTPPA